MQELVGTILRLQMSGLLEYKREARENEKKDSGNFYVGNLHCCSGGNEYCGSKRISEKPKFSGNHTAADRDNCSTDRKRITEFEKKQEEDKNRESIEKTTVEDQEQNESVDGQITQSGQSGITDLEVGSIVDVSKISWSNLDSYFQAYEIVEGDAVYNRIIGKSYRENNDIGLADLRYLKVLHYNFDGNVQVGEVIVNAQLAEDFLSAFKSLYEEHYEIQSMYLIDNYWTGDGVTSDNASIEVNNTSAFCYRTATGSSKLSNHAYGCAIDINSQQNPYVTYDGNGNGSCYHENAQQYLDRTSGLDHVITHEDICYQIFTNLGFSWGGDWSNGIKDFQHFEKPLY